jgi:hypothetical protein
MNRNPEINARVRAMKGPVGTSFEMDLTTCARIAANGGSQFFALQQERLPPSPTGCYFSNDLPAATRYGPTSDDKACQTPCSSNPNDGCGGWTANALYQVTPYSKYMTQTCRLEFHLAWHDQHCVVLDAAAA